MISPKKSLSLKWCFSKKHLSNCSPCWSKRRYLQHCNRSIARRYINTTFVDAPLRLHTTNAYRSNKIKLFYSKTRGKRRKIPHRNYDRHRLRWWSSASRKYTTPSRIPLRWREQAMEGIKLYVNANKTICD